MASLSSIHHAIARLQAVSVSPLPPELVCIGPLRCALERKLQAHAHFKKALPTSTSIHSALRSKLLIFATTAGQDTATSTLVVQEVDFVWKGEGSQVLLTGDFLSWDAKLTLSKGADGAFHCKQKLSPGTYKYKYIIDGEWAHSPDNPVIEDGKGGFNNEITVTDALSASANMPKSTNASEGTSVTARTTKGTADSSPASNDTTNSVAAAKVSADAGGSSNATSKPTPAADVEGLPKAAIKPTPAASKATPAADVKGSPEAASKPTPASKPAATSKPTMAADVEGSPKAASKPAPAIKSAGASKPAPAADVEGSPKAASKPPPAIKSAGASKPAPAGDVEGLPKAASKPTPVGKPAAASKPTPAARAAKKVEKPYPQIIIEDVIPKIKTNLQKEQDISDVNVVFEDNQLEGSFKKKGIIYTFWAFFPDGKLEGSRGFSLSSHGAPPSTVEPFLIDEKKITADLLVFWVMKRLFVQNLLSLN